jgi:hypothetical protein
MNKTVVETLICHLVWKKGQFGHDGLRDRVKEETQALLDKYSEDGYELVSTDAHGMFGATFVYLYFRKSAS